MHKKCFSQFRNVIFFEDIEMVKSFIDFPIMDEGNNIWRLANDELGEFGKPNHKMKNRFLFTV